MKTNLIIKIIGIIIFLYILLKIDMSSVIENILKLNIFIFLSSFLAIAATFYVKSMRLKWLVNINGENIPLKRMIQIYMKGNFYGTITPGKIGELMKIKFMKHEGISGFNAFFSTILDRALDVLMFMMSGYFFILAFKEFRQYLFISSIFIATTAAILTFILIYRKKLWKILRRKIKRLPDYSVFRKISVADGLKIIGISIAAFWIHMVFYYLIAKSLHIPITYLQTASFLSITILVTLIPISFNGVGTREASMIFLFSLVGLGSEAAVTYSLMILVAYFIIAAAGLIPKS